MTIPNAQIFAGIAGASHVFDGSSVLPEADRSWVVSSQRTKRRSLCWLVLELQLYRLPIFKQSMLLAVVASNLLF